MAWSLLISRSWFYRVACAALCIAISSGPALAKAPFVTFGDGFVGGINSASTVTGWKPNGGDSFIRTVDGTTTTFVVPGASATEALGIYDQGSIAELYRD